jgi:hypothetical protein
MAIDLDRITAALAGLSPTRPVTIKAIVESQLSHIEDARNRGLTHNEIAAALTESGCQIKAATLRKYLSQSYGETTRRRPAVPDRDQTGLSRSIPTPPTALPRRSLRRSTLLSSENKK